MNRFVLGSPESGQGTYALKSTQGVSQSVAGDRFRGIARIPGAETLQISLSKWSRGVGARIDSCRYPIYSEHNK